jgi:hypothetical protein
VIEKEVFTLVLNKGTPVSIQSAITVTLYSELIPQEFIRFSPVWREYHGTFDDHKHSRVLINTRYLVYETVQQRKVLDFVIIVPIILLRPYVFIVLVTLF